MKASVDNKWVCCVPGGIATGSGLYLPVDPRSAQKEWKRQLHSVKNRAVDLGWCSKCRMGAYGTEPKESGSWRYCWGCSSGDLLWRKEVRSEEVVIDSLEERARGLIQGLRWVENKFVDTGVIILEEWWILVGEWSADFEELIIVAFKMNWSNTS